jgi:hypothetical protein
MKISLRTVALFAAVLHSAALAEDVKPELPMIPAAAPAHSIQPWNGRDLAGWTFVFKDPKPADPNEIWHAENGVLSFAPKVSGYLRTTKTFSKYHLHLEYRWKEKIANSGVFVHVKEPDVIWPNSVQINLKLNATGDLIPQGGFELNGSKETVKKSGEFNEKPAGEWNGCDIFCGEDSIEVFINGERKNFVEKISANSGFIALQLEGAPIEFRNLWLQDLARTSSKQSDDLTK